MQVLEKKIDFHPPLLGRSWGRVFGSVETKIRSFLPILDLYSGRQSIHLQVINVHLDGYPSAVLDFCSIAMNIAVDI